MAESGCQLTPFQKKKILRVFHILYDVNKDRVISKKDFLESFDKVCKILDWTSDDKADKRKKAKETLLDIWDQLRQKADVDKDNTVSEDEWLKMWGESVSAMRKGEGFPEWQKNFMEFMFQAHDKSEDKQIDLDEYTTFYTAYNVSEEDCKFAFDKISGGKKYINQAEFEELWVEFFTSTSKDSKGNYLFGNPEKYPEEK